MAVPEPADGAGLWAAVEPLSYGWPESNEDLVESLAGSWASAGDAFGTAAGQVHTEPLRAAWPDTAGSAAAGNMDTTRTSLTESQTRIGEHAADVRRFAGTVRNTKTAIGDLIGMNSGTYASINALPAPLVPAIRGQFAGQVAQAVNGIIQKGAAEAATGGGPGGGGHPPREFDNYNKLQQYMFDEMVRNSRSDAVNDMWLENMLAAATGPLGLPAKAAALAQWYELVKSGGPWDHKSRVKGMTGDREYVSVPGVPGKVRFDVWSNMHYGYVGSEAGFDPVTLHAGADAADVLDRGFGATDPSDEAAVQMGIDLHDQYGPGELRPEHINQYIVEHYDELRRAGAVVPE